MPSFLQRFTKNFCIQIFKNYHFYTIEEFLVAYYWQSNLNIFQLILSELHGFSSDRIAPNPFLAALYSQIWIGGDNTISPAKPQTYQAQT